MSVEQTSMNQLITDNIDIWTSTVKTKSASGRGSSKKRELYGVKKLRELILELAVRGKLVPQDPTDEPASILLERIAVEKAQLVKEKKIKKPKKLPEITIQEAPFKLPTGWSFSRLEDLCELITKGSSPKWQGVSYTENPEDVLFVTSENVGAFELLLEKRKYVEKKFNDIEPRSILRKDDFLMNIVGASIGRTALYDIDDSANINQAVCLIRSFPQQIGARFFLTFFNSLTCVSYMYDKQVENARPNLSMGNISKFVIPVPPLKEQHRIVAKLDELMTLCDQLEQQTEASIEAHQVLVTTLLDTLTNSSDADELMQNWGRISEHFDTLFTTEASIDQLKQTILQLAVMGKLVPQDSNDEPAAKLLERIAEEKAQLVKEKKIKKQKALQPITDDEKPFEVPSGWEWTRLGNYSYVFAGNAFKSGDFNNDAGTRVIKITNAGVYSFIETNDFLPFEFSETYSQYQVLAGDLILALTRPYISSGLKVSVCPSNYNESLLNQRVAAIRALDATGFTFLFLRSPFVLSHYQKRFGGSGLQPNLKMSDVTDLFIAVPPKSEQKNIVRKVNELLAICDQLKQRLRDSQQTQLQLTDAIVEQAV